MLRIFRHYVPAALFVLIALDVSVVLMAVRFSSWLGPWAGEGSGWPRTAILTLLVVFALDLSPGAHETLPAGAELLGKSKDLLSIAEELHPDCVITALAEMRGALPTKDLLECRLRGIRVEDWPTFYEKQTGKILLAELRP